MEEVMKHVQTHEHDQQTQQQQGEELPQLTSGTVFEAGSVVEASEAVVTSSFEVPISSVAEDNNSTTENTIILAENGGADGAAMVLSSGHHHADGAMVLSGPGADGAMILSGAHGTDGTQMVLTEVGGSMVEGVQQVITTMDEVVGGAQDGADGIATVTGEHIQHIPVQDLDGNQQYIAINVSGVLRTFDQDIYDYETYDCDTYDL